MSMRVVLILAVLGIVGCSSLMVNKSGGRDAAPSFVAAQPVWPEGREKEMNLFVGFRATVDGRAAKRAVVRLTGATVYRLFVNGEFVGYGPARGPHGYDRVDEWPLKEVCKPGPNVIAIEVAGYNANSYYHLNQPSYLQAEIVAGRRRVLAATGRDKAGFEAHLLTSRVQKVQRYSFQRTFSEVYCLTPYTDTWRTGGPLVPVKLAVRPQRPLLPRIAPYPAFHVLKPVREVASGTLTLNPDKKVWSDRAIKGVGPLFAGFPESELTTIPLYEVQRLETAKQAREQKPWKNGETRVVGHHQFRTFEFVRNNAGFIRATVHCDAPARIYFVFDEILSDGEVNVTRYSCANVVTYDLMRAGTYHLESFEPYELKYLKVMVDGGTCELLDLGFREYVNPDTERATFRSSDPVLNRIFEAARETFKQNAVDVFTDCPGRERAAGCATAFHRPRRC